MHLLDPEEEVSSALGVSHSPQTELLSLGQRAEEVLEISRFLSFFDITFDKKQNVGGFLGKLWKLEFCL